MGLIVGFLLGMIVNYFLDDGLNCVSILFFGVVCFLVVVVLGLFCYVFNVVDM